MVQTQSRTEILCQSDTDWRDLDFSPGRSGGTWLGLGLKSRPLWTDLCLSLFCMSETSVPSPALCVAWLSRVPAVGTLADLMGGFNPTYALSRPTDATLVRPRRALAGSRRPLRVAQGCARAVGGAPRALVVQPTSLSRTRRFQA